MGTVVRPEITEKSPYYIGKHRYYELKHFCLQYPDWKKELQDIDGLITKRNRFEEHPNGHVSDLTAIYGEARYDLSRLVDMIDKAAEKTCGYLTTQMIESVTEGISYEKLVARNSVHCSKEIWYAAYRRFFWLLDKLRK